MLRTILKKITAIEQRQTAAEAICCDLVAWKIKSCAPEHMSVQNLVDYTELLTITQRAEKINDKYIN